MNLYFDTDFTSLDKYADILSIGIVSDDGKKFYAEFTDYNPEKINYWVGKYILDSFTLDSNNPIVVDGDLTTVKGSKDLISKELSKWLGQYKFCTIWTDCISYNWVLFCDIFDNNFNIPTNIHHLPLDLSTLIYMQGVNDGLKVNEIITKQYALLDADTSSSLAKAELIKKYHNKLLAEKV